MIQNLSMDKALFHGSSANYSGNQIRYNKPDSTTYSFVYPFGRTGIKIDLFTGGENTSERNLIKGQYSILESSRKGKIEFRLLEKAVNDRIVFEGEATGYERVRFYLSFPKSAF